jgi:integrase
VDFQVDLIYLHCIKETKSTMKAALELSSKPNRDGLFEIYIRIQDGAKRIRKKTNYAVNKTQFKTKSYNQEWVSKHPKSKAINSNLKALLEDYNSEIAETLNKNLTPAPKEIVRVVTTGEEATFFLKYLQDQIKQMLNYNQRKGYITLEKNWVKYMNKKKVPDFNMKVTKHHGVREKRDIVKGFQNFLAERGLATSSQYTNLKRVRSIWNMAISDQLLMPADYIFKGYKMPSAKSVKKKEKLTPEELKELIKLKFKKGSIIKAVQQGFFLAYNCAGARIEDILTLSWKNVLTDRIEYVMSKGNTTEETVSIKITPAIKAVLNYFYSVNKDEATVLGLFPEEILKLKGSKIKENNEIYKKKVGIVTSMFNQYLKDIADDACISKTLSSHVSRHTFASIAIKKTGGDVHFVQGALKHSNAKITQDYLDSLDLETNDDKMAQATAL